MTHSLKMACFDLCRPNLSLCSNLLYWLDFGTRVSQYSCICEVLLSPNSPHCSISDFIEFGRPDVM